MSAPTGDLPATIYLSRRVRSFFLGWGRAPIKTVGDKLCEIWLRDRGSHMERGQGKLDKSTKVLGVVPYCWGKIPRMLIGRPRGLSLAMTNSRRRLDICQSMRLYRPFRRDLTLSALHIDKIEPSAGFVTWAEQP
ncbi:hypothetical protein KL912_000561 [Ogataea haglerorum]|nr:hypothetical protein KL912_000561 [Ogataea haglerorum]